MMFNVCVKFHENMSSRFKVMEQTRKLLKDTHTHRKDGNIIPPCRSYKKISGGGCEGWGMVWGVGVDGWTDEQAQTNLPLQLL